MIQWSPSRSARGGQAGEVGAGVGFGVADRDRHLALLDAADHFLAHFGIGIGRDDRRHRLGGQERVGEAGAHHFIGKNVLLDVRQFLAAQLLRPAQADPAVGAHARVLLAKLRAAAFLEVVNFHFLQQLRRHHRLHVLAHLLLEGLLLCGQFDVHISGPLPIHLGTDFSPSPRIDAKSIVRAGFRPPATPLPIVSADPYPRSPPCTSRCRPGRRSVASAAPAPASMSSLTTAKVFRISSVISAPISCQRPSRVSWWASVCSSPQPCNSSTGR